MYSLARFLSLFAPKGKSLDTIIERKWHEKHRLKIYVGLGILALVFCFGLLLQGNGKSIEQSTIRIADVSFGNFQEIIVAGGFIEPKTTMLIDAGEGGTVMDIRAEEGQMVNAGDVLLTLQNEALILDYMQRETQIVEQINNLRNTRIGLEQNFRQVEDQLADFSNQFAITRRQFKTDSVLYFNESISEREFQLSRSSFEYLKEKVRILSNRIQVDREYQQVQFGRIDGSIQLMERNLGMIRSNIEEMSVRAPLSGQLNSFDLETGQVLARNSPVGRIDVPNDFMIRALVDQHYLSRIALGQTAKVEYNRQKYNLIISKLQTTVENGQFEIQLNFTDSLPADARRGQNFQVHIEASALTEAVKIPRGAFYQSSGGSFVFVLDENQETARKQPIKLGKQNPDFYEVLEGLEIGQSIIISSYNGFEEEEEINIKKDKLQ